MPLDKCLHLRNASETLEPYNHAPSHHGRGILHVLTDWTRCGVEVGNLWQPTQPTRIWLGRLFQSLT